MDICVNPNDRFEFSLRPLSWSFFGECVKKNLGWRTRRWVVEVSHSWSNPFRRILARCEKLKGTYLALLHMAAAIIAYRKAGIIYG